MNAPMTNAQACSSGFRRSTSAADEMISLRRSCTLGIGVWSFIGHWSLVIGHSRALIGICIGVTTCLSPVNRAAAAEDLFKQGSEAYSASGFEQSATFFREAASIAPAAGTLHNL